MVRIGAAEANKRFTALLASIEEIVIELIKLVSRCERK